MDIIDVGWEGPFEGWSKKFVVKNLWRVEPLMEYADAVQECCLLFLTIRKHYRDKVDNPGWLMSLFKTTVNNHWNTISLKASAKRVMEISKEDLTSVADAIATDGAVTMGIFTRNPKATKEASMTVYQELVEKLGVKPGVAPKDLMDAIGALEETKWNTLSDPAQTWYNKSATAMMDGGQILPCEGYEAASEKPKPAAAPKPAVVKKPRAVDLKPPGAKYRYKETETNRLFDLIVADPDATDDSISAALAKEGITLAASTVTLHVNMYRRFRAAEVRRSQASGKSAASG